MTRFRISIFAFSFLCFATSGCHRPTAYVPVEGAAPLPDSALAEGTIGQQKYRCPHKFEEEGPVQVETTPGKYQDIIPQRCRALLSRHDDLVAITTREIDSENQWEKTIWLITASNNGSSKIVRERQIFGFPGDFTQLKDGTQFKLINAAGTIRNCALCTPDNRLYVTRCGTPKK